MTPKKTYKYLLVSTIASIGFMILLFAFTKKSLPIDTSFKRDYTHRLPSKIHEFDLESSRYYIAGAHEGNIYLGHPSAPLSLTIVDSALQKKEVIHISIDQDSLPMRNPQLRVIPPHFFLMDGTVPYILRGNTNDWNAYSVLDAPLYFVDVQAIDSASLAISTISSKTKELALGTIRLADSATMTLSHTLLQKQVDGVFDVGGDLQYNQQRRQFVYTYLYRNQYIVANDSLELQLRGKTIDTISQAQIKIGEAKDVKKIGPALKVNGATATYGDYLFVDSQILGAKESLTSWKNSTVIDVYHIENNTYAFSFYVEDIEKQKLRAFYIFDDKFIGLIGKHMVVYELYLDTSKETKSSLTALHPNFNTLKPKNINTELSVNHTAVREKTENLYKRVGH